MIQGR